MMDRQSALDADRPTGWHWAASSRGSGYYTHWLYTNLKYHYQGTIYWDGEPGTDEHIVEFFEETGLRRDGDVEVSEYATVSRRFDSEAEAIEFAVEKAEELIDYV